MNERYFEILISRAVPQIFGEGFRLIGQQLSLDSGRLDLLLGDDRGIKHIVEIKKGAAVKSAVEQVCTYIADFERQAGIKPLGWVVANEIPDQTRKLADSYSIQTKAISFEQCQLIKSNLGPVDTDLLGKRVASGALHGGGVHTFKKYAVDLDIAISELPVPTAKLANHIFGKPFYTSASGRMQIVIIYKGFKLGGFNRKQNQFYFSTGLVLNERHTKALIDLGFRFKRKTQASSTHEHSWWSIPLSAVGPIGSAVSFFSSVIDEYLIEGQAS